MNTYLEILLVYFHTQILPTVAECETTQWL